MIGGNLPYMTYDEFESPEVFIPPGEADPNAALMLSDADIQIPTEVVQEKLAEPTPEPPPKPKRTVRRKKTAVAADIAPTAEPAAEIRSTSENNDAVSSDMDEPVVSQAGTHRVPVTRRQSTPILTVEVGDDVETEESRDDIIWHEIHNAYRTRRILTGTISGIEQIENGKTIVAVEYKGFRILIPLKEMLILLEETTTRRQYADMILRQVKLLGNMLGAEIDFLVRGIDSNTRAVVASRRDAMLLKRQKFYFDINADGSRHIYEGRIVQARVVAVGEKAIRVEVFGIECSINARDLTWHWMGDAHEYYSVGDKVLVRVQSVKGDSPADLRITADIRSITQNTIQENLKKCRVQSKYVGKVTDVRKGVVYIRLNNGVNAIAHTCYDYRMPGKKDEVSFAVTKLDEEKGVALGIITRIIRQNL